MATEPVGHEVLLSPARTATTRRQIVPRGIGSPDACAPFEMKLFHFYRREDQSGVSGTGAVVEGVEFTNGWCALRWISSQSSLCFYRSLEEVRAIHSHGGKTELILHDFDPLTRRETPTTDQRMELLLAVIEEASRAVNLGNQTLSSEEPTQELVESLQALKKFVRLLESSLLNF